MARKRLSGRLARVRRDVRVEQPERFDDLATDVAEQWVLEVMRSRERLKNRRGVGKDRDDADARRERLVDREVQLDQLIATVRSPISRTSEHHQ
jgi:hypothetical protein